MRDRNYLKLMGKSVSIRKSNCLKLVRQSVSCETEII